MNKELVPMSDDDIKKYFPNIRIVTQQDIEKCRSIDELLDKKKLYDGVIILYQNEPNSGHWIAISRIGDTRTPDKCFVEFFDSYGGSPTKVYNYFGKGTKSDLGIKKDVIENILTNNPYNVIYNKVKFQSPDGKIATCGRHCCFRLIQLLNGRTLPDYITYMKDLKKKTGKSYDEIVTDYINL